MTIAFCIYAAVSLWATVCFALKEFRILQINGYRTSKYVMYMMKNITVCLFPCALFITSFSLWFVNAWTYLLPVFCLANLIIAILNQPKNLVFSSKMKNTLITFFVLIAIFFALAVYYCHARGGEKITDSFCWQMPYFLVNIPLYFTPVLVPLSNLVNPRTEQFKEKF